MVLVGLLVLLSSEVLLLSLRTAWLAPRAHCMAAWLVHCWVLDPGLIDSLICVLPFHWTLSMAEASVSAAA